MATKPSNKIDTAYRRLRRVAAGVEAQKCWMGQLKDRMATDGARFAQAEEREAQLSNERSKIEEWLKFADPEGKLRPTNMIGCPAHGPHPHGGNRCLDCSKCGPSERGR